MNRYQQFQQIRDNAEYLRDQFQAWPPELGKPIIEKMIQQWKGYAWTVYLPTGIQALGNAMKFADELHSELQQLKLSKVSGNAELCDLAKRGARLCEQYAEAAKDIVQRIGLEVPDGKDMTDEGKLLRMQDVKWWRRTLRRIYGQAVENAMRSRGHVRKGRAAYCTDWALNRRRQQKTRMRNMLKEAIAINEEGQQFELFDVVERSVSNPAIRRAELMTRIRGFEEIAAECGHIGLFGTLTAPSCYHAQHAQGGINKLYEAAGKPTVRAAQQWLCKMWARFRSKMHKLSIEFYGFRIAEPHHDGTPHWHFLLFVAQESVETLCRLIRGVWLSEHAEEKGARKHRCRIIKIQASKGTAAGYIAKYVAKNIDGFEVGPDYEAGGQATTTAHRVDAWASTHRIRQFQQIGGAPVGLWREIRRCRTECNVAAIEEGRMCADACDWSGFNKVASALTLWKEQTGECNQYREAKQPQVVGVQTCFISSGLSSLASQSSNSQQVTSVGNADVLRVRTRLHEWRINWSGNVQRHSVRCDRTAGVASMPVLSDALHSDSAREARNLGPVSITVRSSNFLIYQHAGKWFAHRAISVAKPPPLKIDQRYSHVYTNPYVQRKQFTDHRHSWANCRSVISIRTRVRFRHVGVEVGKI